MFSSCATDQYSSAIISEMLGIHPKITYRIDNLCNSGTNAVTSAFAIIASGLCDTALVVGAEKIDSPGNKLLWDVTRGSFMFPVHWAAIFAKAHMRRYGTTEEQMAKVSVKNHKNATKNPHALFGKEVALEEVMNSKKIASPIKLLDCSAPCDGASAILLVSEEKARSIDNPVFIKGIGQQTTSASFAKATADLTSIEAAKRAAHLAFEMSHTKLSQIDVAELHDAFTILEILAYEDLGFAKKGEGGKFVDQRANSDKSKRRHNWVRPSCWSYWCGPSCRNRISACWESRKEASKALQDRACSQSSRSGVLSVSSYHGCVKINCRSS